MGKIPRWQGTVNGSEDIFSRLVKYCRWASTTGEMAGDHCPAWPAVRPIPDAPAMAELRDFAGDSPVFRLSVMTCQFAEHAPDRCPPALSAVNWHGRQVHQTLKRASGPLAIVRDHILVPAKRYPFPTRRTLIAFSMRRRRVSGVFAPSTESTWTRLLL